MIVGFASYGKAGYEDEYNGGMGSNGLTSARHDVFAHEYAQKYPESYDQLVPDELVYAGKIKLTDIEPVTGLTYGKLVLSPTRTYLPVLRQIIGQHRGSISGMIHCTGGAQTKVMKFVKDLHVIKDNLFPVPPLFKLIQEESKTSWQEMYKVFNMGHRMEIYVPENIAADIIAISNSFNIDAQIVGRVEAAETKQVTVKAPAGSFVYN